MKRTMPSVALASALLAALLCCRPAAAGAAFRGVSIRETVGVRSLGLNRLTMLPTQLSFVTSVDFGGWFRGQIDIVPGSLSFHLFYSDPVLRLSGALGAAFPVMGRSAPEDGGWEIVLPLLAELAYLHISAPPHNDMGSEVLRWIQLGPSAGADFTLWKPVGVGFTISLKAAYLFRLADPGSEYEADYLKNQVGCFDVALLMGVSF